MAQKTSRPAPHELERMPPEERQKHLEERMREIIAYAYERAPAVKERLDEAGVKPSDIRTIKDLEKIPLLRKDDLIALQKANPPFGGYLAVPMDSLERIYQSLGPIYDPQRKRGFGFGAGLGPDFGKGQIVMNTWSYHITPAGLGVDEALRRLGFTVVPTGTGNTELQVKIMHDLKVHGFVGTPSFLKTIIDKAEEMGYDFKKDFNLKWAMVGGEMGGEPLRKLFQEKYGILCLGGDSYATADVGTIATGCEKQSGMHITADAIVEIVDPATGKQLSPGEVGEVVVTPFDEVYPLIRFGTGDLSCLIDEPCGCGRTTPRLPKIMGRSGEAVRVRGMFVHPRQTDEVISRFPEVSRYQLVVTRPQHRDEMTLKVELADESVDKDKLRGALDKDFRDVCKVRFDRVEFVPKGTIAEGAKRISDERVY
ncbi:MAG TPA: phenylacetate--CoA ligase family protein [Dehalococcoidia bacterium]|nr:phenylacetate--CoA ligase family protein [Dehalococcoidia bacterium]